MDAPAPSARSSAKRLDVKVPTIIEHTDRLQVYFARAPARAVLW